MGWSVIIAVGYRPCGFYHQVYPLKHMHILLHIWAHTMHAGYVWGYYFCLFLFFCKHFSEFCWCVPFGWSSMCEEEGWGLPSETGARMQPAWSFLMGFVCRWSTGGCSLCYWGFMWRTWKVAARWSAPDGDAGSRAEYTKENPTLPTRGISGLFVCRVSAKETYPSAWQRPKLRRLLPH